jgi:quercetin dioxygenase-like cupin family protein
VHVGPGEEHWHGAAPESYLLHVAISLGAATWLEPVRDEDYAAGAVGG